MAGAGGGVGLDWVAGGARPLSTTLDLSFRDDFVAEGKTVAGGAMGRGLGWGLGVLLAGLAMARGEAKPLVRLTGA